MKNRKIYYDIYSDFYSVNKYRELKSMVHHGNNRLDHINRVAKMSYNMSKLFGLDYISTTRGALMHDFFLNKELSDLSSKRFKIHPQKAYENSKKYFKVNELEKNIILSHMYPITKELPKYKESYIVSISDKIVSIYEFGRFQIKYTTALILIFCVETFNNLL